MELQYTILRNFFYYRFGIDVYSKLMSRIFIKAEDPKGETLGVR